MNDIYVSLTGCPDVHLFCSLFSHLRFGCNPCVFTLFVSGIWDKTSEHLASDILITTDTCHLKNTQCVNLSFGLFNAVVSYLDWPRTNRGPAQSEPLQPAFSAASYLAPFIHTFLKKLLHIGWVEQEEMGDFRQLLCKVGGVASHPFGPHFHFFPHNTQKPTTNQLFHQNLCWHLKTSEWQSIHFYKPAVTGINVKSDSFVCFCLGFPGLT